MKFIHTSDWHLGQNLLARSRQREHQLFLDWLLQQVEQNDVELLIVAGDIFDCGNPPGYAQRMYFDFLGRLMKTCCRYVLITGGNHDSPAFLNASREILQQLNIYVFGKIQPERHEEVLLLRDRQNNPAMILCAVPFLRDRDVRQSLPGESYEEKSQSLLQGINRHYHALFDQALLLREQHGAHLPIVATGHLFAQGGRSSESVRDIYVGNLGAFSCDGVVACFDYLALGHLHVSQLVGGKSNARYCGSPIPMSFDEAVNEKKIILATAGTTVEVSEIAVPVFQPLRMVSGSLAEIELAFSGGAENPLLPGCWVEVHLTEEREVPNLTELINGLAESRKVEVLAIRHLRKNRAGLTFAQSGQRHLSDLRPEDVFERRLEGETDMPEDDRKLMRQTFKELLELLNSGGDQT